MELKEKLDTEAQEAQDLRSSGHPGTVDTPPRALLQDASALTTFHPWMSPLEMQTFEGGSDWARLSCGPNRVVRDIGVVIGHLPEATGAPGN